MKPLNAFVVEDHHDALWWIYREIGAKRLPVHGTALLHFDSHPDLLLPEGLTGAEACSGRRLLPQLSIGDWILPAVYAGHIGRVLWLRPPWARQLPEGDTVCALGPDDADGGRLRLDCAHPYFVSELLYAPAERLREPRTLRLTVLTLPGERPLEKLAAEVAALLRDGPYVLDIDLDFFSTRDPFLELLPEADVHDRLRALFTFPEPQGDVQAAQERRRRLLAEARAAFDHVEAAGDLADYAGGGETRLLDGLREMVAAVRATYPDEQVDWQLVYDAACTFDCTGLPHHVTDTDKIDAAISQVGKLLAALPEPAAVTVARSSLDNYCPPDQVEHIQERTLACLRRLYPRLSVRLEYDPPEQEEPEET